MATLTNFCTMMVRLSFSNAAANNIFLDQGIDAVEEEIVVGTKPSKITTENVNMMKMTLMDQTFHIVTILWQSIQS